MASFKETTTTPLHNSLYHSYLGSKAISKNGDISSFHEFWA